MFKPCRYFLAASFALISLSASAELHLDSNENLKNLGVDPGEVLSRRFSYEGALRSMGYINGYLESFRMMTEKYNDRSMSNTGADTQSLGFFNHPRSVEGALRWQQYRIQQLEYELAQRKYAAGEIKADELAARKAFFEHAEADFQKFWDGFRIAD